MSSIIKIRVVLMIKGIGVSDMTVSKRFSKDFVPKSYKRAT